MKRRKWGNSNPCISRPANGWEKPGRDREMSERSCTIVSLAIIERLDHDVVADIAHHADKRRLN